MRLDIDAKAGGSVYDDWVKRSPQNTSLRGIVNGPSCSTASMFQRPGMGSGDVIHRDDATGNTKGRWRENIIYDRWHMKCL
jgi:hypothetical protein